MTSKQDKTTDQTPSPLYLSAIRTDYQTVDTEEFQFLTRFEMVVGDPWNFHAQNILSKEHGYSHPHVWTKFTSEGRLPGNDVP